MKNSYTGMQLSAEALAELDVLNLKILNSTCEFFEVPVELFYTDPMDQVQLTGPAYGPSRLLELTNHI